MTALTLHFLESMLYCDAVLIESAERSQNRDIGRAWAISVMGNEQVVRQFVAACAEDPKRRTPFSLSGRSVSRRAIWAPGKWWCQARQIGESMMHLVAMPPPVPHPDGSTDHLILPRTGDDAPAAIYGTLLRRYTTPLIPPGIPGQPPDEAKLGRIWQERVSEGVEMMHITRLVEHPEQPDHRWQHGMLLRMTNDQLDRIVATMITRGKLPMEDPCPTSSGTLTVSGST